MDNNSEELKKEFQPETNIEDYIKSVEAPSDSLKESENFRLCSNTIKTNISQALENLNVPPAPGLESADDFLAYSLKLYDESLEDLRAYLLTGDSLRLEASDIKKTEADDISEGIDEIINLFSQSNKQ